MEKTPQSKKIESPNDYKEIARSLLGAFATKQADILDAQVITAVQKSTGYALDAVKAVFAELAEQKVLEGSMDSRRAGMTLTEAGRDLFNRFDELMPDFA